MGVTFLDDAVSPFLNVFKDGQLVDSFCLDGHDSFILGRHTNCDVLLAHPSISRHHLEIQLLHATRELRLTDLDSVHGTWIDGKQVPPLTPVTVKEGEAIKLGASSRTYKVQWLPHPQPVSSNERSCGEASHPSADSERSNTGNMKHAAHSTATNESCIDNLSTDHVMCTLKQEGPSSPTILSHGAQSPHIVQEILVSGGSANGLDTFNANISFQISQQKGSGEGLPPLPPPRRIPFAPLQQQPNVRSPAPKKIIEKKVTADKHEAFSNTKENAIEVPTSKLWLRRCNSAPSPRLEPPAQIPSVHALGKFDRNGTFAALPERNDKPTETLLSAEKHNQISATTQSATEQSGRLDGLSQSGTCWPANQIAPETYTVIHQGKEHAQKHASSSFGEALSDEEYPSDKENKGPAYFSKVHSTGASSKSQTKASDGASTGATETSRRPFQPLVLTGNGLYRPASPSASFSCMDEDELSMARHQKRSSVVVQNLDHLLQKLQGSAQLEPRYKWHVVVDTTCLLDSKSLKSLKLLEGIKEVRLIVPQIVIRELDFGKRKDKKTSPRTAVLKWIESCMVKYPSWIHVQNSSESLGMGLTPPASPLHPHSASPSYVGHFSELMSPTNGDHVLNCALLFSNTVFDGQVALLTNDTALKIKAMAEGLVCETAVTFCDSVLSPYSDRFIWAGSTAHGHSWTERACQADIRKSFSSSVSSFPSSGPARKNLFSAARAMASRRQHNHHVVEGLKNHCKQKEGLKVVLN